MEATLAEIEQALRGVEERRANIRAGYVYVISNIGSFGEGVVKIGLTRRLETMERVVELGSASVPFRFDVHTLFFSHDAVGRAWPRADRVTVDVDGTYQVRPVP